MYQVNQVNSGFYPSVLCLSAVPPLTEAFGSTGTLSEAAERVAPDALRQVSTGAVSLHKFFRTKGILLPGPETNISSFDYIKIDNIQLSSPADQAETSCLSIPLAPTIITFTRYHTMLVGIIWPVPIDFLN
jgi:hypothetical protein